MSHKLSVTWLSIHMFSPPGPHGSLSFTNFWKTFAVLNFFHPVLLQGPEKPHVLATELQGLQSAGFQRQPTVWMLSSPGCAPEWCFFAPGVLFFQSFVCWDSERFSSCLSMAPGRTGHQRDGQVCCHEEGEYPKSGAYWSCKIALTLQSDLGEFASSLIESFIHENNKPQVCLGCLLFLSIFCGLWCACSIGVLLDI